MVGDLVGYSRLMEAAEEPTAERLRACQALVTEKVTLLHGRVFNTAGDAMLAEFPSPNNALRCAVEVRCALANAEPMLDGPLQMRFGLHLADVMVNGDDLIGDGVNLAARIQQIAAPDTICVSGVLFDHVRRNSPYAFEDLGELQLKNISSPIRVYRVRREPGVQINVRMDGDPEDLAGSIRTTDRKVRADLSIVTTANSEPVPTSPPALPHRPSIAVLPFTSVGVDDEGAYFARGVADDIITELARNRDLFVVARHSSFFIGERESDPAAIGRALGVRHLLGGSIRRAREQLRLTLHLVECESGREAWAERYDRRIEDLFDVQLEVARTVTATVAGRLSALADDAIAAKAPESFEAYDHVLRTQRYLQRYTRADYARAREHLEAAIGADPFYARPYGLLCLAGVYDWFWEMPEGGLSDVLEVGQRALSLDDGDAKAHLGLAVAHLFAWRHDRARHHMERAVALSPNDDLVAAEHARLLTALGQPDKGLSRVREAMRLNPYHPNWYWNIEGLCLQLAGRYQEAIDAYARIDHPHFWVEAYLAACNAMYGRVERAAFHRDRLLVARPDFHMSWFRRGLPISSEAHLRRLPEGFRQAGFKD